MNPTGRRMGSLVMTAFAGAGIALAGCATHADHFYMLNTLPDGARVASAPTIQVRLQVTVPAVVDRPEMVMNTTQNGISILDHERWGAPFSDQVSQTLARDIEARRKDIFIGDRRFDQASVPPVTMKVDIVRMTVRRGGQAGIEAHWRIVDSSAGVDQLGSGYFEASAAGDGYEAVAQAYSRTLSDLADRLVQGVRVR